ncbi:TetR family transcriptional regulator [Planococcus donghaensis]|uniref:TetR family transcriptional regulator n=1 Tax=Planococcus donghaensis TaxID=414778 RepID=UPI003734F6E4
MSLREKKAARKKEEILRSASLVIARNGYQNATMEDIAAELLMTKGSLYYYFKNKEELLYKCHELILSGAMERIEELFSENLSSKEKMQKALKIHLDLVIREKEVFNLIGRPEQLFSEGNIEKVLQKRDEYASLFDKIIDEGVAGGEFLIDQKKMARMMILGAANWVQVWYSPEGKYEKEKVEEIYAEYLLKILM